MKRIYGASKTKHAHIWKELRNNNINIISTWIDDVEVKSYSNLWNKYVYEVSIAEALILYIENKEDACNQRGTLVEVGVALANKIPIYVVYEDMPCREGETQKPYIGSWVNHMLVTECFTLQHAISLINKH